MLCARTKEWLLQAELPRELHSAPADVAAHFRGCAECQQLVTRIRSLEREWRDQPLPASVTEAREAFLARHGDEPARPSVSRRWRYAAPRWLIAACLVLTIGITGWFMSRPQKVHAESDVIDRLIDWNVQLSQAGDAERQQLYAGHVELLRAETNRLPEEDRAFAESLITNGEWLVKNPEPIETADRFAVIADQIVDRLDNAAARNDPKASARLARQYMVISNQAVKPKVEHAKKAATDEPRRRKLEKVEAREARQFEKLAKMQERLETMHDNAPPGSRKDIRKLLDESKPKPKPKKHPEANPARQGGGV